MPLSPSATELDFLLADAGGVAVSYNGTATVGLLDTDAIHIADPEQGIVLNEKRVSLRIRDGALANLLSDARITVGGASYVIRDAGYAEIDGTRVLTLAPVTASTIVRAAIVRLVTEAIAMAGAAVQRFRGTGTLGAPAEALGGTGSNGIFLVYNAGDASPTGASFTRTTPATYRDATTARQTAGINVLRSGDFIAGAQDILLEGISTNHFASPGAPATQTSPSLATGTYTLWMEGTGSIAVAGTTATITGAGTATASAKVTFVVTVAGTVTYTVTGTPTLAQAENRPFSSSYIGSVSGRAADNYSVPFTAVPQVSTFYVKFVELGTIKVSGPRILQVGANAAPFFTLFSTGTVYSAYHHNGSSPVQATLAVAPVIGDTVELRGLLNANGSVQISQSINGGAETSSTTTAANALAGSWNGGTLYLGTDSTTALTGFTAFQSIKIARGVKTLAQMRAFTS